MPNKKISIPQAIMTELALKIMQGEFVAGTNLPGENELSEKLEASRTSVRNALQGLEGKGLISIQAKIGSIVNHRSQWNFLDFDVLKWIDTVGLAADVFEQLIVFRLMYEPATSALAALNAKGDDLARMETALNIMHEGAAKQSRFIFEKGDIDFHYEILQATYNPFLLSIGQGLREVMLLSFKQTQDQMIDQIPGAVEQHRLLFEAIRLRDSTAAKLQMKQIIIGSASRHLPGFDAEKYASL